MHVFCIILSHSNCLGLVGAMTIFNSVERHSICRYSDYSEEHSLCWCSQGQNEGRPTGTETEMKDCPTSPQERTIPLRTEMKYNAAGCDSRCCVAKINEIYSRFVRERQAGGHAVRL